MLEFMDTKSEKHAVEVGTIVRISEDRRRGVEGCYVYFRDGGHINPKEPYNVVVQMVQNAQKVIDEPNE